MVEDSKSTPDSESSYNSKEIFEGSLVVGLANYSVYVKIKLDETSSRSWSSSDVQRVRKMVRMDWAVSLYQETVSD